MIKSEGKDKYGSNDTCKTLARPIIFFDWDDSLFPTTAVTLEDFEQLDEFESELDSQTKDSDFNINYDPYQCKSTEFKKQMNESETLVREVLIQALKVGTPYIVTCASEHWLNICHKYYPTIGPILSKIKIIHVLEEYKNVDVLTEFNVMKYKSTAFVKLLNSHLNKSTNKDTEINTDTEINSDTEINTNIKIDIGTEIDTATNNDTNINVDVKIDIDGKTDTNNKIKINGDVNIISAGDMPHDYLAMEMACNELKKTKIKVNLTNIKFSERPSNKKFLKQLLELKKTLKEYDKNYYDSYQSYYNKIIDIPLGKILAVVTIAFCSYHTFNHIIRIYRIDFFGR